MLTLCDGNLSEVVDIHDSHVHFERRVTGRASRTHSSIVHHNVDWTVQFAHLLHCIRNSSSIGQVKGYQLDLKCWRWLTQTNVNTITL